MRIATAVGQRKQGAWTKWESAKNRAVTWSHLKHMELQKLSFLIKTVHSVLPTAVDLHACGLTTSNRCRACGKTASLNHILSRCDYTLRNYMWIHNKVLEIFTEAVKICCETANKVLNDITNRAIHFIKEGNILKLSCKNKHRSSLLNGCMDWLITTDLENHFVFLTEIVLTTQHPDIVIKLTVPIEKNFDWAHNLEKYEDLQEQCVRSGWITNAFPIEVKCRGFITNLTSIFLTNLGLSPSKKGNT